MLRLWGFPASTDRGFNCSARVMTGSASRLDFPGCSQLVASCLAALVAEFTTLQLGTEAEPVDPESPPTGGDWRPLCHCPFVIPIHSMYGGIYAAPLTPKPAQLIGSPTYGSPRRVASGIGSWWFWDGWNHDATRVGDASRGVR